MTNEQILKKAYSKAVINGWDVKAYTVASEFLAQKGLASDTFMIFIFSHDFAKHLWIGYKKCESCNDRHYDVETGLIEFPYLFHLQEMVKEEDPIKYLEKYI